VARRSGGEWLEEQWWRRVAEVGEGEGQYGQRRHNSGVTLFDDVNFANPFYIMAKERNQGLRVAELQISL
jgi:hypothetical protein